MDNILLAELVKSLDNLQTLEFEFGGKKFKWFFKYLSLLERARINQFCVKAVTTYNENGTKTTKYEKDDNLFPIHLIIEKALNKDGKKIFSHTNTQDFKTISSLPFQLAIHIASHMTPDVFGTMDDENKEETK
jgi:hypothetical protein